MSNRNYLKNELKLAKELGFKATERGARSKNPYMLLEDGNCLLWLAGGLIAIVTTEIHFGNHLHRRPWKSSKGNAPDATLSATELNSNGIGEHTEIYYREAYRSTITCIARDFNMDETDVVIDHINHMRGDCRTENLRPATKAQNNLNRSTVKVEKAFYNVEDFKAKVAALEWVPLK